MTVSVSKKSVSLLIIISQYVLVNCHDPNPCESNRYGNVPHPKSCAKYYDCSNYMGKEKNCPSDRHFHTKARYCVPIHQSDCAITTTRKALFLRPGGPPCYPNQANMGLFNRYDHLGKTYYLSKDTYTTDKASHEMCKTLCGYLAEIDDEDEYEYAVSMIDKHDYYGVLIAGTDTYTEGTWEYERTMKRVNYFKWCLGLGEPNNSFDQDCMAISKEHSCMLDHQCLHQHDYYSFRYLCEVD
ncbi:unnamed protein product [Lymnaea stagnalis]|uniref:Uncharacterized protein n=1 Tax=Lymnaea stagnalis TaxID=6523 RepID=A0AAV2HZD3_LYMST